jgi:hypothetical protein
MLKLPQPDRVLSAWDVKGVAADAIGELPLPGIEGRALDPGDIWSVVILASANQTSIREVCTENQETPVMTPSSSGSIHSIETDSNSPPISYSCSWP